MTFIKVNNWNMFWQLLISTITQSVHILTALGILNQSIIDHTKCFLYSNLKGTFAKIHLTISN